VVVVLHGSGGESNLKKLKCGKRGILVISKGVAAKATVERWIGKCDRVRKLMAVGPTYGSRVNTHNTQQPFSHSPPFPIIVPLGSLGRGSYNKQPTFTRVSFSLAPIT